MNRGGGGGKPTQTHKSKKSHVEKKRRPQRKYGLVIPSLRSFHQSRILAQNVSRGHKRITIPSAQLTRQYNELFGDDAIRSKHLQHRSPTMDSLIQRPQTSWSGYYPQGFSRVVQSYPFLRHSLLGALPRLHTIEERRRLDATGSAGGAVGNKKVSSSGDGSTHHIDGIVEDKRRMVIDDQHDFYKNSDMPSMLNTSHGSGNPMSQTALGTSAGSGISSNTTSGIGNGRGGYHSNSNQLYHNHSQQQQQQQQHQQHTMYNIMSPLLHIRPFSSSPSSSTSSSSSTTTPSSHHDTSIRNISTQDRLTPLKPSAQQQQQQQQQHIPQEKGLSSPVLSTETSPNTTSSREISGKIKETSVLRDNVNTDYSQLALDISHDIETGEYLGGAMDGSGAKSRHIQKSYDLDGNVDPVSKRVLMPSSNGTKSATSTTSPIGATTATATAAAATTTTRTQSKSQRNNHNPMGSQGRSMHSFAGGGGSMGGSHGSSMGRRGTGHHHHHTNHSHDDGSTLPTARRIQKSYDLDGNVDPISKRVLMPSIESPIVPSSPRTFPSTEKLDEEGIRTFKKTDYETYQRASMGVPNMEYGGPSASFDQDIMHSKRYHYNETSHQDEQHQSSTLSSSSSLSGGGTLHHKIDRGSTHHNSPNRGIRSIWPFSLFNRKQHTYITPRDSGIEPGQEVGENVHMKRPLTAKKIHEATNLKENLEIQTSRQRSIFDEKTRLLAKEITEKLNQPELEPAEFNPEVLDNPIDGSSSSSSMTRSGDSQSQGRSSSRGEVQQDRSSDASKSSMTSTPGLSSSSSSSSSSSNQNTSNVSKRSFTTLLRSYTRGLATKSTADNIDKTTTTKDTSGSSSGGSITRSRGGSRMVGIVEGNKEPHILSSVADNPSLTRRVIQRGYRENVDDDARFARRLTGQQSMYSHLISHDYAGAADLNELGLGQAEEDREGREHPFYPDSARLANMMRATGRRKTVIPTNTSAVGSRQIGNNMVGQSGEPMTPQMVRNRQRIERDIQPMLARWMPSTGGRGVAPSIVSANRPEGQHYGVYNATGSVGSGGASHVHPLPTGISYPGTSRLKTPVVSPQAIIPQYVPITPGISNNTAATTTAATTAAHALSTTTTGNPGVHGENTNGNGVTYQPSARYHNGSGHHSGDNSGNRDIYHDGHSGLNSHGYITPSFDHGHYHIPAPVGGIQHKLRSANPNKRGGYPVGNSQRDEFPIEYD